MGEVTQDKQMSKCDLTRVLYHQLYNVYQDTSKAMFTDWCKLVTPALPADTLLYPSSIHFLD